MMKSGKHGPEHIGCDLPQRTVFTSRGVTRARSLPAGKQRVKWAFSRVAL
jgi:hypothetical protein